AGTSIIAQLTGTTGGVGSYQVLVGGTQVNCASQPLKTQTTSWTNQGIIISQLLAVLPMSMQAEVDAELAARGLPEPTWEPIDPSVFAHLDPEDRVTALVMAQGGDPDPDAAAALRDVITQIGERSGYLDPVFRSVGYTQGGSSDNTDTGKVNDL